MITTTNRLGGTDYVYNDGFDNVAGIGRRAFESILCGNCHLRGPYRRYGDIVKEWSRSYDLDVDEDFEEDQNGQVKPITVTEDCATTEMHYTCPRCGSTWTDLEDECE